MVKVAINQPAVEVAIARRNLSRKALAYEMGVSRYYLGRILNGKIEPSAAIRQRLLDYFKDYTFDDLFILEGNGGDGRTRD
jgi:transcriptional regulator with XRE-family HTH domain